MQIIRCAVDRAEENFFVLVSDEGKSRFDVRISEFEISVGNVVDVYVENGKIIKIELVDGEAEKRLIKNRDKLHSLFKKGKR